MENQRSVFVKLISTELNLPEHGVANTLSMLDEGFTVPFISRYRKERTGELDEVQITAIHDMSGRLKEIAKRKETIINTITEQNKMTDELRIRINNIWNATELEDIYMPYKPKRRTRAQIALEMGLEPLAKIIMSQREREPEQIAKRFVKDEVKDITTAIKGAQDIIAEHISEDEWTRQQVRGSFRRDAFITSKLIKAKGENENAAKYSDYFNFSEPLRKCSSHRLLAIRRGENEGILRVNISVDDDNCIEKLYQRYIHGHGKCCDLVAYAIKDGYKRLLKPSIETEFAALSKEKADKEAINVFAENLRQLLLSAPLGQKRVMGVDPGFRTGCKIACLDTQGNLLHHEAIFPHPPVSKISIATTRMQAMIKEYAIEAIGIGNGTASRETKIFVDDAVKGTQIKVFMVSEAGASVYSASKTAREEFPNEDVTVRGAVSIGRRLIDPLAELVKIDPKSIGIGQYQHDVDQIKLKKSLDHTVESCVNLVGVNLNTASKHLLSYVSGLSLSLAQSIVEYRRENGAFTSRTQLKKVPRLGPVAYQQCAGFLRIPDSHNPLDNSAVHPESYNIVEHMANDCGCTVEELIRNKNKRRQINIKRYITSMTGQPTLTDIMQELDKPGRDPREQIEEFEFDPNTTSIDNLVEGIIFPGIVTNITNFGAFVDIGVHQDGLVHISQIADRFITDPTQIVRLHQHVKVKIIEIDRKRKRISLSMKGIEDLRFASMKKEL